MHRRLEAIGLAAGLAAFMAGCSCGGPPLKTTQGQVSAVPALLVIGAYPSCGRIEQINLVNSGQSATTVTVTLEGAGVFQLRNWDPVAGNVKEHLQPGSNLIDVQCRTGGVGNYDATLKFTVDSTGQTGSTHLHCDVLAADPCISTDPCAPAVWNPDACICDRLVVAEDGPCNSGNACSVDERCVHGSCVGSPRNCDDSDVCTRDACLPGQGCINIDVTDQCPVPKNLCMVAACDRKDGCKEVPADGKKCGKFDCTLAQLCEGGTCTDRTPRDGDPCVGDCGDGTCQQQLCIGNHGRDLSSTDVLELGATVENRGLVDPSGNLILVDPDPKAPAVAAFSQTGQSVWNPGGANPWRGVTPGEALAEAVTWDDHLVVATGLALTWLSSANGEFQFDRSQRGISGATAIDGYGIAVRSADNLVTAFAAPNNQGETCKDRSPKGVLFLKAYNSLGRDLGWTWTTAGRLLRDPNQDGGLVADEDGNLLLTVDICGQSTVLQAISPSGTTLWTHPLTRCLGCEVQAAHGGQAYLAGDVLVDYTVTGATEMRLESGASSPLLADGVAMAFDEGPTGARVRIIDPTGATLPVEVPLDCRSTTGPFLTRTGTVMVLETRGTVEAPTAWIAELAPDGKELRACQLGDGSPLGPPAAGDAGALIAGTILTTGTGSVVRIKKYTLPHFGFAEDGWRQQAGGPDRGWAP